ncbi:tRNA uridine(34) 5-carboxymethylaminomethyl modification radical SAM/GNAT enzyme Elp3 [archaeon]|nr:tRNA uridine(34) 5-carboxymethylaminomethyl modification radical SAM/GNAT enzyme Elp3 [archaeon]
MIPETVIQEILGEIKAKNVKNKKDLGIIKREISKKYKLKKIPTDIRLLLSLPESEIQNLNSVFATKPTRSLSGVSPVAIMTRPAKCPHGKCTYCVGGVNSPWGDVPQSYTGHEPATMRGKRNDYDAYLQVSNRLQQYVLLNQPVDKIEIIVMGGTFPAESKEYQDEFILGVYQALNDFSDMFFDSKGNLQFVAFKKFFELPGELHDKKREKSIHAKLRLLKSKRSLSIEEEQVTNEKKKVRCVALCIETKPDWGLLPHGNVMLDQGCTRVELGIQSVYDDVLAEVNRGHDTAVSKKSIQILRDLGFKINFHYMPGLPLTDRERDISGMKQLFTDSGYKPDMIKFYPCMVGPGTALYYQWKEGKFKPIDTDEAASRLVPVKKIIPSYCRVQRIQRDVPTKYWEGGVGLTNFRQHLHQKVGVECRCIRCREPKNKQVDFDSVKLNVKEFEASGGKEFFISFDDEKNDLILGFARLRFVKEALRPEITANSALLRELHVYGVTVPLEGDEKELSDSAVQHKGYGKKLVAKAEEIARFAGCDKMIVISGVGVREYYRKLGYVREGPYMVKEL